MSLFLFALFAAASIMQFVRISNEKIYQARVDTFQSDERAYDASVDAYETCVASIKTRETYRGIFSGISALFRTSADLPVALFPNSQEAVDYQNTLKQNVTVLLDTPVEDKLPRKLLSECPAIPDERPVKPER